MEDADPHQANTPTRIVIADDFELVRIGLCTVLKAEPDMSVVGVASDGQEVVDLCVRLRPDVAILDERMPVLGGIEAARRIRPLGTRVIVLSPLGERLDQARMARYGLDGWLLKNISRAALVEAVRQVRQGQTLISAPDEASRLNQIYSPTPPVPETLTPRELDVLRLLARGKTNAEIANDLALSRGTVKAYVEQIIAKLHVSGRTHAAVRAVEMGLLRMADE
ncbi:MAG: response regulator transcription factor [Oscillochloridaceae bacterium]|nr:response regulator transcription factor [Chloroflexaceae bacterium]MDW8392003.1 response regulator transcription factor [Oscillochloridaceae bacterium]